MNKTVAYQALVEMRKKHRFPEGLLNPAEIEGGRFDSNQLGPWSRWQGNLEADVLIVGQDWGDLPYFLSNGGVDEGVGAEKNMLLHSCVAAWKDPTGTTEWASQKLSQPEAGDRAFFYKNKVGVIATALFDHTGPFPSNAVFGLRHRGEFNRKVFDLKANPTRLLSCRAIQHATGENFRVLQTIFRIKNLKIAKFIEESF